MANPTSQSAAASITPEQAELVPGAPLEAILCTGDLDRRASRPPNDRLQTAALKAMLQGVTESPQTVLTSLVNTILDTLQCDSAGLSLINESRTRFYWPAVAGVWAPHVSGGAPLNFGPCGDVIAANRSMHMRQVHLRYTYLADAPLVNEGLLVPFYVEGEAMGTIWAIIHSPPNNQRSSKRSPAEYDREDLRLLEVLGELASAAYRVWSRSAAKSVQQ